MNLRTKFLTAFAIAAMATAVAQGPGIGAGQGNQNGNGSASGNGTGNGNGTGTCQGQLDMTQLTEVSGVVTNINIGAGIQNPSIEVGGQLIRLAPEWFLLENDFEVSIGQSVTVQAVPSTGDPYLHAVWIRNESTGLELTLREGMGAGNWARRGGSGKQQRQAPRSGGNGNAIGGCGVVDVQTVTGTVVEVTSGVGIRQPNVVIKDASGVHTIKIGPSRVLLEAEFSIVPGDVLTVTFGTSACTEEKIALTLVKGDNVLDLRDENGRPVW